MGEAAKKVIPVKNIKIGSSSLLDIKNRRSNELVIGLCGAIGSGVKTLKEKIIRELTINGYHVEHIRVSDLISERSKDISKKVNNKNYERYNKLQDLGDLLRKDYGNFICAELSILKIKELRELKYGSPQSDDLIRNTHKTAYVIDQIKHPAEVEILKEVYRNNFYLLGLLRTVTERKNNLGHEGISDDKINDLIERDRKSADKNGQQVEEALQLADYFIRNLDTESLKISASRLVDLIHGTNNITPTKDESGMYAAYSASLRSACLSRQVGAAVVDNKGNILSTGCNDVPSYGGGLYSHEISPDKRCFNKNGCHNDQHKNLLKEEIEIILSNNKVENSSSVADEIMKNTKAKYLIEYSRAVHAEMDAIISIARSQNTITTGATLYCTTYPCHSCARHIVAAGITRVVYIEPYEKSLALTLHDDSICQPDNGHSPEKVLFQSFEGVAPKRYAKFFAYNQPRKDSNGKPKDYRVEDSYHVDTGYLDSYSDYETKVIQHVQARFPE